MAPSRKIKRGKSRRNRGKKVTRRQRGGGEYVLKFASVPVASKGNGSKVTPPEGLGDLGIYTALNQGFTIATKKKIHDIKIFKADGKELGAESFGTDVQTKIKIKVGEEKNLVPSSVVVRGATPMSSTAPKMGVITMNNLNASTLNLLGGAAQSFVVKITTANEPSAGASAAASKAV
jgi:hypothetical protein